jgi:hypothetical protein
MLINLMINKNLSRLPGFNKEFLSWKDILLISYCTAYKPQNWHTMGEDSYLASEPKDNHWRCWCDLH